VVTEERERLSLKLDPRDSRTCRRARRFRRNLYVAVFLRNLCRLWGRGSTRWFHREKYSANLSWETSVSHRSVSLFLSSFSRRQNIHYSSLSAWLTRA